jgi:hypothetical protein
MKNILTILLGIVHFYFHAQTSKTFLLFSKEMDKTILSLTITSKNEIQVLGSYNAVTKEKRFTEKLEKTSNEKINYFRIDQFGVNKKTGYMILKYEEDNRILKVLIDTTFKNKLEIENFISDKKNIESQLVFYLILGIHIEQLSQFPPIMSIKAEDIQKLKIRYTEHYEPLTIMFDEKTSLFSKLGRALYFSNQMWLNTQCLLLGYKPPQNKEEYDYLQNAIK